MRYVSTRGEAPVLGFDDVVLAGLATDGGLYVPDQWPEPIELPDPSFGYAAVAAKVLAPFVRGSVIEDELGDVTAKAYAGFSHPDVAPLMTVGDRHSLLELHWGPTLSFKDYALALVGAFFDRILRSRDRRALVLGATSGDTGSAAMAALAGMESVDVVILYPDGRVSDVQRRQMTTIPASNVHAVAVEGNFDDCQDLVKAAFSGPLRDEFGLAAVNSINWARIAVQAAFHMWAAASVDDEISVAIPTGNFGNALSATVARRMGAPIRRLVIANNANHGMADLVEEGRMSIGEVSATLAPAMDIGVPSNLERYLFEVFGRDASVLRETLRLFRSEGLMVLDEVSHAALRADFRAGHATDEVIEETIAEVYESHGIVLDPHTATAWRAGLDQRAQGSHLVTLATAHPAKFGQAVASAIGRLPDVPNRLGKVLLGEERIDRVGPDVDSLGAYLRSVHNG